MKNKKNIILIVLVLVIIITIIVINIILKKHNYKSVNENVIDTNTTNNELVDTLMTNEEGKAISKLLEKGEYYLKEIDSGSPYYLINSDIFKVEIKEHGEIVSEKVEDDSVDIEVEVEKLLFTAK